MGKSGENRAVDRVVTDGVNPSGARTEGCKLAGILMFARDRLWCRRETSGFRLYCKSGACFADSQQRFSHADLDPPEPGARGVLSPYRTRLA